MKAIIMAGGEGSRLRPLTCDRPKPLVPVLNKPIMEYSIELLKKHGITEIGVTLQYLPQAIIDYFGNGSKWGVNLYYFLEDKPLGTAGSVKNAEEFLDEPFIVISGDALTDFDLTAIIESHFQSKAPVTIVLTSVSNPLEYGIVITDSTRRIQKFLEKPGWGEVFSDTVNTGIYVIEPEVLQLIPKQKMFDFSKDLFPMILASGNIINGCLMQGYWCDIGNIKQYHQAHLDLLDGQVNVALKAKQLKPGIFIEEACEIAEGALFEPPVWVGKNVRVAKNARIGPYSVIGHNNFIDENASVKRAVLWNGVYVGKGAQIRGSLILKGVKIRPYANVYEGATIGDESLIEENVIVKPDVKIWPHKLVEQGRILNDSLIWGTKAPRRIFGNEGISGLANIDITPEFTAKLAAAFASCISQGSKVALSAEAVPVALMLKDAFGSGLLSAGVNVLDLGESLTPVTRFAVANLTSDYGVHIKYFDGNVTFIFMDKNGANISKADERKIENAYAREDFRRVVPEAVLTKISLSSVTESYVQEIFETFVSSIKNNGSHKILVHYDSIRSGKILNEVLKRVPCQILYYGKEFSATLEEKESFIRSISEYGADFGVIFDPHGENLIISDSTGRIISEDEYDILLTLVMLAESNNAKVVVPFQYSSVYEKLAEKYAAEVVRTKTSLRDWMEAALKEDVRLSQGHNLQFKLRLDAIHAFAALISFLVRHNIKLQELFLEIPQLNYCKKEIHCPWDKKGKVMRRLIEEGQKSKAELLDGIKFHHQDGWTLILPDSDKAVCKIFSEGNTLETAEELAGIYLDKIKEYSE